MFRDLLLTFVSTPLSLVAADGVAIASPTLDLLGAGVGVAPPNIIGTATVFGTDFGVGAHQLEMACYIGTALVASGAATLNAQWQFAPDPGAAGNYTPTTWTTVIETGALAVANLTANTRILAVKYPQIFPFSGRPRFTRLNFVVPSATHFTAGTIANAFLTDVPDAYSIANQPSNFKVQ